MNEAGRSDEQLSAELQRWTGGTPALHPVGELLDRHWEAAFAYARLCTDGPRAAGMLTTAAFTRLFGESLRQAGPTAAWRPHVLVAVRRIAAEWDSDGRQELLHPALRSGATGERAAARLLPPPGRRLLSRAFQRVPQISRAVLWHTEVEAEPLAVPAGLLGLDEEDAGVELRRGRERLREECLQVHRELAPENECRRYLRMLDVTFRRGGVDVDPDLREHLGRCGHCSRTADQLAAFNTGLGLALAEAVLGWGAQAYMDSRASRPEDPAEPAPHPETTVPRSGEAFLPSEPPGRGGSDGPADRGLSTESVGWGGSAESAGRGRSAESERRGGSAGGGRRGGTAESMGGSGSVGSMGSDGSAEPTPPGGSAGGRRRGRFPGATSGGGVAGAPPRRGTGPAADADVFASGSAEADAFASGPQSAGASAYPSDADVLASGSAEADAFASDTTGSASAGRSFDAAAFADADAVASRPSSADAFASRPPSAGEFASRLPSAGASVQPSDADVFASASADADVFASGPPSAGASAYPSDADVFASASAGAEVFASGSPSADFAFPAGAVGSSLSRRSAGARASGGPGEATPSGRSAHRAARARRARRRNVALAVVTVSGLVVLPLVLWSALGSGDGPAPAGKDASSPAPGKDAKSPGASWAGRHRAGQGTLHGRLHNLASGLCVGVVGKKAVEGAETELAPCSTTLSQQWAYEPDGLLRNSAAPGLCLDSHLGYSVRLAPCSATGEAARNIRYDFTLQGALIPRWNQDLALTPAATDGSGALVLKDRAPGAAQRWTLDTAKPDLQMQNVDWDSDAAPSPVASPHPRTDATPAPKASRTTSAPRTPSPTATGSGPAATPSAPVDPCSAHPYYCGWGSGGYGDGGGYGGGPHRR